MARIAHSKDERIFGRHEVKVVRRLKTADYLINVDYFNWASSVMAVAILSLTDDLSVGLVTSETGDLYPADCVKSNAGVVTVTNYDAPKKVVVDLQCRSIGCGISDSSHGHYDYRRDLTARDRILGDAGLMLVYFYGEVLCRKFDLKLANQIYDHMLNCLIEPVDTWQINRRSDGLVRSINAFYPITERNETLRDQFISAVKFLQELLPRIITNARVEAQVGRRHVIGGRGMLGGEI